VYAGHDGRITVATLAPLFFYFLHRGVRTGRIVPFAGAAATLAASLLSFQIQNSYVMLLGGGIWACSAWSTTVAAGRPLRSASCLICPLSRYVIPLRGGQYGR
jgi:hypothetical protein